MCVILNGYILLGLCLWEWMKSEVCERKVDTPDNLLAHILDAVPRLVVWWSQSQTTNHEVPGSIPVSTGIPAVTMVWVG